MSRRIPGMGSEARCAEAADTALVATRKLTETGEQHRTAGRLRPAIDSLHKASLQLGQADALIAFCQLEVPFELMRMFGRLAVLHARISDDCEHGQLALSGHEDGLREAIRKWRKPLPPQKGGAHGGKKGGKGYDRKRDKQRSRREG